MPATGQTRRNWLQFGLKNAVLLMGFATLAMYGFREHFAHLRSEREAASWKAVSESLAQKNDETKEEVRRLAELQQEISQQYKNAIRRSRRPRDEIMMRLDAIREKEKSVDSALQRH